MKLLINPFLESSLGATYCICKDGLSDQALQKSLDYACGAGADCTAILQNGPCFQPNTVKDHCSYAVNNYFQRKGQVQGSCDFSGTAMPSQSPPGIIPFFFIFTHLLHQLVCFLLLNSFGSCLVFFFYSCSFWVCLSFQSQVPISISSLPCSFWRIDLTSNCLDSVFLFNVLWVWAEYFV